MRSSVTHWPPQVPGLEILEPLARGGMGVVWLAREEALDRLVALKTLADELVDDPEARERFRREAQALARVRHPHVVPIHSFGESGGLPWFTMAYLEGETLAKTVRTAAEGADSLHAARFRRAAPGRFLAAAVVAHAIAEALACVHDAGVLHRDVKPSNVLIDRHGRPILVDFGVACDPTLTRLTRTDAMPGTLRYLAPEQLRREGCAPDTRVDVRAVGLLLFEMIALRPMYPHEDVGALVDAILHEPPPSLLQVEPAAPPALAAVVERACARDPERRPAHARSLASEIARAVGTFTDASAVRWGLLPDPSDTRACEPSPAHRPRLRRSVVVAASGALLLAAAVPVLLPGGDPPEAIQVRPVPDSTASHPPSAEPPYAGRSEFQRSGSESEPTDSAAGSGARPVPPWVFEMSERAPLPALREAARLALEGDEEGARRILAGVGPLESRPAWRHLRARLLRWLEGTELRGPHPRPPGR